jgi:hypothetical protein
MSVVVRDITGDEDKYVLDIHGFQLYRHQTRHVDFFDEAAVTTAYFAECIELLKEV